jgi:hypothetical protein
LVMAVPFLLSWLRLATSSSARFGAASPYLFVRKIPYVIRRCLPRQHQDDRERDKEGSQGLHLPSIPTCRLARNARPMGL